MSVTFPGHGVCSCPSKGCGVCLSTLVPTTGRCTSKQGVSKGRVWELLIAKHLVVSRESSCKHVGFKQVQTPCCIVNCTVFFARSGAIIHRAARVIKSICAALRNRRCPLRLALTLDTTTCEVKTWWKLRSCVMSAKSVVTN